MLVDFENIDYIKVCPETHTLQIPDCYIPASTWGFVMGDITEQKDLMELISNIEIGITPEQIALLQNVEREINEINNSLDMKVDYGEVYTKREIDNKGYLTEHQSLTNYYTKSEVDKAIENVEVDLTGYATEQWVKEQNYLTEHQSLTNYYTKSEVDDKIDNIEVDADVDLTGYATEQWVKEQNYLTEHQSLADYYTKSEIDNKGYLTEHQSLTNYYTKTEVDDKIDNIDVDVDLTGYYTKTEVDDKIDDKLDTNKIWSGTQSQWDALSATEQNSYIIAMIQQ